LVNLDRSIRNPFIKDRLTHRLKRAIRLKASVSLLVSLSTCGADKLDAPKLLSNKAKKRFITYNKGNKGIETHKKEKTKESGINRRRRHQCRRLDMKLQKENLTHAQTR